MCIAIFFPEKFKIKPPLPFENTPLSIGTVKSENVMHEITISSITLITVVQLVMLHLVNKINKFGNLT